jgi:F0F1-type ATP synthase assembly protein I
MKKRLQRRRLDVQSKKAASQNGDSGVMQNTETKQPPTGRVPQIRRSDLIVAILVSLTLGFLIGKLWIN